MEYYSRLERAFVAGAYHGAFFDLDDEVLAGRVLYCCAGAPGAKEERISGSRAAVATPARASAHSDGRGRRSIDRGRPVVRCT